MVLDLLPAAITRASSLIEGFDFIENLFQEVSVNSRLAVRDNDRADGLLVELNRPSSADDSIDVAEFAQPLPEGLQSRGVRLDGNRCQVADARHLGLLCSREGCY